MAPRESVDAYRDFACGHHILIRFFTLSLCLSLFQAIPPRTELSRNSIDKSRDPISRWPRYGHYHRVNRTTRRKRKRKRRRELVQPGPRQSSDGSCPTDAAFGEVKRKRRREKTEKERDGDSISTKTHQTVVLVSFCYVVCVCVCVYVAFYPSRHFLPTVYSPLPFSPSLLLLLPWTSSLSLHIGTSITQIKISFAIIGLFMKSGKRFQINERAGKIEVKKIWDNDFIS